LIASVVPVNSFDATTVSNEGLATVTVGENVQLVRPNESTYIPIGEKHRLANDGRLDLVLIEAQVGEYTGEDDIIRFEDDYGRQ